MPLLEVANLTTRFRTDRGVVTAVDDVSFAVEPGQMMAIVGESGCGKTVTSKSIMRLLPERNGAIDPASRVWLDLNDGQPRIDLVSLPEQEMRHIRGSKIAMIFQEPMTSLNPVFTIGWQIDEALKYHTNLDKQGRAARVIEMLKLVEIPSPEKRAGEYPHQLSGGMRQRVMIAIALCCEPRLLIADEPTTALDVTIQAQILALMENLRKRLGTAIMFITHNLGLVAQVCDRVIVMYAGRVVEQGTVREIFHHATHPYTKALLTSIPKAGRREHGKRLPVIPGIVPSLFDLPKGCRFADRCPHKQDRCVREEPAITLLGQDTSASSAGPRQVRCHYPLGQLTTPAGGH
jgi:peptide/nickel transport system ATP-binding protein